MKYSISKKSVRLALFILLVFNYAMFWISHVHDFELYVSKRVTNMTRVELSSGHYFFWKSKILPNPLWHQSFEGDRQERLQVSKDPFSFNTTLALLPKNTRHYELFGIWIFASNYGADLSSPIDMGPIRGVSVSMHTTGLILVVLCVFSYFLTRKSLRLKDDP